MVLFDGFCNAVILGGLMYAGIAGSQTSIIGVYEEWHMIPILGIVAALVVVFGHFFNPLAPLVGGIVMLPFVYRSGGGGGFQSRMSVSSLRRRGRVVLFDEDEGKVERDVAVPNKYLFSMAIIVPFVTTIVYMAILYAFF